MHKITTSLLLLALGLSACTATTPIVAPRSASPSASASPSPTAKKAKVRTARSVVYVLGDGLFIYDVKTDRATRVATGQSIRQPRWVRKDEVSFIQGATVRLLNIKTREVEDVVSSDDRIQAYGWTPDRETIGIITVDDEDYPKVQFRSLVGDRPILVAATLPPAPGRELTAADQMRVEFDRTGSFALIVYTPSESDGSTPDEQAQLQIRSLGGALLHAGAGFDQTMGFVLPNGKGVYYRSSSGARLWTASTERTSGVAGGTRWFNPWPSRDSKQIAYDTGMTSKAARIRLLTIKSGRTVNVGPSGRAYPVIASPNTIWAQAVRSCSGVCLGPVEPGETVYAINVKTGRETKTAIGSLVDADAYYA